jgi:hypothetical protein
MARRTPPFSEWEAEKKPQGGDPTPDLTYGAVGYALSTWEELEYVLFDLFARLSGRNMAHNDTMVLYSQGRIFRDRFDTLLRAFGDYFRRYPNQHMEGDFDALAATILCGAEQRNNISHGIVVASIFGFPPSAFRSIPREGSWYLIPANYNFRKQILGSSGMAMDFQAGYIYTSTDIENIADKFFETMKDVRGFMARYKIERHLPPPQSVLGESQ